MNADLPFPSGRAYRRSHARIVSITGIVSGLVVGALVLSFLELSTEGWKAFLTCLLVATAIVTPISQWQQSVGDRPVADAIDAWYAGTVTHDQLRDGFRALGRIPVRDVLSGCGSYLASGIAIPIAMVLYLGELSTYTMVALLAGSVAGGFATAPFQYLSIKRFGEPLRERWAASLSPEERNELGRGLSLRWKLALPMALVGTGIVTFSALLAHSLSVQPVEKHDVRGKLAFLDIVVETVDDAGGTRPGLLDELRAVGQRHAVADALLVLDRESGEIIDGDPGSLGADEIAHALEGAAEAEQGDGVGLSSTNSFAWKAALGGRLLVFATTPERVFREAGAGTVGAFLVLFVLTVGFSLAVALLVARDVAGTAHRLRQQADRIAAGDLRSGAVVESEDELGFLARSFDAMSASLRETIGRVVQASEQVDASSVRLAAAGQVVADSTNEQVTGLEQATMSMGSINQQVSGITDSAQVLNGNVEEASSSVLELGAASEELNQTASALNTQVEEVSSSIEQMVRSVSQIAENNDGLAAAVEETSSSMAEMAAAMREVESNANETSRLSGHVVELADGGRDRVQQTITGMAQIRDATETAEQVIEGLAGRMQEIGAIVDVIDDVADETNLLALNAAIIAAQAGDQGRSFSVVAEEIKDLADRVLSSTKEIGGLIESVQTESQRATTAIQDGAERVQQGVDLSAEAGLSLEQITSAARDSGSRIEQIVQSVQEQSRATAHVAELMERVSSRVEQIRGAGREQQHGNEVVMRGAVVMRDVAQQTHRTTEEQSRGALRIRDSIESVRDAVDRIHASLQDQSEACRSAVRFLEQVHERTRANDEAASQMRVATTELKEQALALRTNVQRFQVE